MHFYKEKCMFVKDCVSEQALKCAKEPVHGLENSSWLSEADEL